MIIFYVFCLYFLISNPLLIPLIKFKSCIYLFVLYNKNKNPTSSFISVRALEVHQISRITHQKIKLEDPLNPTPASISPAFSRASSD